MGVRLALVVGGMLLLSFASVPLYALFCKATGFGGTTQMAATAPKNVSNRKITVRFNTDVSPGLSWTFKSSHPQMTVRAGEVGNISYRVENESTRNEVGIAVFQVQPDRAGLYFNKIQCFCFNQERWPRGRWPPCRCSFSSTRHRQRPPAGGRRHHHAVLHVFLGQKPQTGRSAARVYAYEQRLIESAKTR